MTQQSSKKSVTSGNPSQFVVQTKDSGIEWLGEIPEHWKVDRMKDVSRLRDEKIIIKTEDDNYLELEDLEQGTGKVISFRNTLEVSSSVMRFKKGDVLFGKLRPYLEKYYFTKEDGYCTGEILAINPVRVDGKFLNYFVGSPNFIKQCNILAYGAKMPRVNWNTQIASFLVPLPPLPEQKAIAEYLDKACARIDRIIAIKEEQLRKIKRYLSTKISQYVTVGLDINNTTVKTDCLWIPEIRKGWKIVPLKRLLAEKLKYGANESAEEENKDDPRYIRITDFGNDGKLKDDTFKSLAPEVAEPYLLKEGDVLFARSGATVGKTFIFQDYSGAACFAGYLIKANTLRYRLLPEFLYYFTKSKAYEEWKNLIFTQATIQNIGADKYQYLIITVPEVQEQQEIVETIEFLKKKIGSLSEKIYNQITTLQSYRKSLIHECVTGKKQVADVAINIVQEINA